jgi:DeoR family transcriptional regulator, suf operon transcriptional repressor
MPASLSPSLESLPATRRAVLLLLKKRGEAGADQLAAALGITVSAVRQHLARMVEGGLVAARREAHGPGRPPHRYSLTPAGDALFPRFYAELTNELLDYAADDDPDLVDRIFERRRRRRLAQARDRLAGGTFDERVTRLTEILDSDGYLAEFERRPDGSYLVTEHNCAILGVAQRYRLACSTEIEFLREALPDATVERVAHMMAGAHVCAYEIRRVPAGGRTIRAGSGAGRRTRATDTRGRSPRGTTPPAAGARRSPRASGGATPAARATR